MIFEDDFLSDLTELQEEPEIMLGNELKNITEKAKIKKELENMQFFEDYLKENEALLKKRAEEGHYYAKLDVYTQDFMNLNNIKVFICNGCKFYKGAVSWNFNNYEQQEKSFGSVLDKFIERIEDTKWWKKQVTAQGCLTPSRAVNRLRFLKPLKGADLNNLFARVATLYPEKYEILMEGKNISLRRKTL